MSDEQFHEFHLDGKQMVFLFMASTVVAVVIFLCGVMVGRGVRANKSAETVEAAAGVFSGDAAEPPSASSEPGKSDSAASPAAGAAADTPPPETPAVTLEKPADGEAPQPVDEPAPSATEAPARTPVAPVKPAKEPAVDAASTREPAGGKFSVQVKSGLTHTEADAQVNTLKAKGFESFIVPMPPGKPGFRVRVGTFKTLAEARAARERLRKMDKYHDAFIPTN
jgi:cell division protein FtsN